MSGSNVSVVIPTFNRKDSLIRCLQSIQASSTPPLEVIVIDDASSDGTYEILLSMADHIRVISHEKSTLPAFSVNEGIRAAVGDFVFIVDDDNILAHDTIERVAEVLSGDPRVGVVGTLSCYLSEPDRIIYAGAFLSPFLRRIRFIGENEVDSGQFATTFDVPFCHNCIAVRRDAALRAGLVDPWALTHFNYEIALQSRLANAGYRVVTNPKAKVWHDIPFDPRGDRVFTSSFRLYYVIRSKLFFERGFDSNVGRITFALSLPLYLAGYLVRAGFGSGNAHSRYGMIRIVLRAFFDGILGRGGLTVSNT